MTLAQTFFLAGFLGAFLGPLFLNIVMRLLERLRWWFHDRFGKKPEPFDSHVMLEDVKKVVWEKYYGAPTPEEIEIARKHNEQWVAAGSKIA